MSADLTRLLHTLPLFTGLRPDELEQIAARLKRVTLEPGARWRLGAERPEAVLVLQGRVSLEATLLGGTTQLAMELDDDDHAGFGALLAGTRLDGAMVAREKTTLALLDAEGWEQVLKDFPVVAIGACAALAEELAFKDDLLREVAAFDAERVQGEERRVALAARRRRVASRLARRQGTLARRLTALRRHGREWVAEPAFWMLAGFLSAFGGARALVGYILSSHSQGKFFALRHVEGFQNPIHIHHFNYGLVLISLTSFCAFFPAFRRHLRVLGLVFGIGMGLVFDEFALIWNFNPDYYQALSSEAVIVVALILVQPAFFRRFWLRQLRRARSAA